MRVSGKTGSIKARATKPAGCGCNLRYCTVCHLYFFVHLFRYGSLRMVEAADEVIIRFLTSSGSYMSFFEIDSLLWHTLPTTSSDSPPREGWQRCSSKSCCCSYPGRRRLTRVRPGVALHMIRLQIWVRSYSERERKSDATSASVYS